MLPHKHESLCLAFGSVRVLVFSVRTVSGTALEPYVQDWKYGPLIWTLRPFLRGF